MAEDLNLDGGTAFSFNIEETSQIGDRQIVDDLFGTSSVKTKPEDVATIEEEDDEPTPPPAKVKKAEPKPAVKKAEEEGAVKKQLTDFLKEADEDEEEDDENEENTEDENGEDGAEPTDNQFQALANDLSKLGVFTLREGETTVEAKTPEEFLDRFRSEVKLQAGETIENFIGQFGEDYQKAFDAIFVKGVDPKDYFQTYDRAVRFAELDLTKPANQELVIRQSLLDQGWEEEDIPGKIKKITDYGDLQDEAAKAHKVLVKNEARKLQQLEADQDRKLTEQKNIKQQFVQSVNNILQEKLKTKDFDGLPINLELAKEIQENLLVEKYKTASGELLTQFEKDILDLKRPENHQLKVKYSLLLSILKKDPTLSSIKKKAISKETDDLFAEVRKKSNGKVTSTKSQRPAQSSEWNQLK